MTKDERLSEAKKMRKLVAEAIEALTKRGAKSWTIGGQTYTSIDVGELLKLMNYYDNVVSQLSGGGVVVRRIVPIED